MKYFNVLFIVSLIIRIVNRSKYPLNLNYFKSLNIVCGIIKKKEIIFLWNPFQKFKIKKRRAAESIKRLVTFDSFYVLKTIKLKCFIHYKHFNIGTNILDWVNNLIIFSKSNYLFRRIYIVHEIYYISVHNITNFRIFFEKVMPIW